MYACLFTFSESTQLAHVYCLPLQLIVCVHCPLPSSVSSPRLTSSTSVVEIVVCFHYHSITMSISYFFLSRSWGPTNKKLRCHLPLFVPRSLPEDAPSPSSDGNGGDDSKTASSSSPAWLRVAGETRGLQEGKCVVFDDSFRHEAANESPTSPRIVLILGECN